MYDKQNIANKLTIADNEYKSKVEILQNQIEAYKNQANDQTALNKVTCLFCHFSNLISVAKQKWPEPVDPGDQL